MGFVEPHWCWGGLVITISEPIQELFPHFSTNVIAHDWQQISASITDFCNYEIVQQSDLQQNESNDVISDHLAQ